MFLDVSDFSSAWDVHSHRSIFSTLLPFLSRVQESLICLKTVLNGLKHDTSKGCKTWEVWDGSKMMSNPEFMANVTTSRVTCELCLSSTNKCLFSALIPTILVKVPMKCEIHDWKSHFVIHALGCIVITTSGSHLPT
jgi:hypothetical protein